ncbi:hypothetical protein SOCEGT47_015900 [Sorangium cellulosum]|uniref:Uncharacterized protein n=1 Tax=Sorangium cellulosum TaxID=56 RepID=A0A4V0ND17_SORCE|nr:hypothetical protein [Sorangium cellulosum]AUX21112.1 hypothetical protein SOCEGT47_015900 [Sorangium cellulosum]
MTLSPASGAIVAWPWLGKDDRRVCERAWAALLAAGALRSGDAAWGAPALCRGVGGPEGHRIPWASWALRLCARALAPAAAGDAAVAVAVVAAGGVEGAPDALARGALAARLLAPHADEARARRWLLCLAEHAEASWPRNPAAASTGPDATAARLASCARESVALWTAPALFAGDDLAPASRFGAAVATPIWLLDGLVRLWLDPAAPDLAAPTLTPLLALWLGGADLAPPLLRALSGERASPVRRLEICSLLASRPYRAALAARVQDALASARAALESSPRASPTERGLAEAAADFLDALGERFRFFEGLMSFRDLLGAGARPRRGRTPADAAGADLRAAVEFLVESSPWQESWEVQRFGVLGSPEEPVGQWFVRATILMALLEIGATGRDVRAEAAALLDEIPAGELRYFGAFRELPPDADDLAIMLQLVAATGAARGRAETWIEVMLANVGDDGIVPTWFYRGPAGPTTPGATWAGDDCAAVRLNLLAGLLSFDAGRFARIIDANARRALDAASAAGVEGAVFYDASYTDLAFLRFARLYRARAAAAPRAAEVAAAESIVLSRMLGSQRLDGGFGTPLRTAACLEGAAMMPSPEPLLLERGARYLGELQLVDGSWPAEPLYRVPMKDGREGHHLGRALTTALCARGLAAALSRLGTGGERRA